MNTNDTPIEQYAALAKKIMLRRSEHKNNENVWVDDDDDDDDPTLTKKQLKELCDKKGIEYTKKATNLELTKLLEAV